MNWIENAICMRNAGLPLEAIIDYVGLYQQGDETIPARLQLLREQRENLNNQKKRLQDAMDRLDFKIARYEEAEKTGILSWEENSCT